MQDESSLASLVSKLESSEPPVTREKRTTSFSSSTKPRSGSRILSGAPTIPTNAANSNSNNSPPSPAPTSLIQNANSPVPGSSNPSTFHSSSKKTVDTKFKFQFQGDAPGKMGSSPLIDQQVQKMIQQAAKEKGIESGSSQSGLWGFMKRLSSIDSGSSSSSAKVSTPSKATVGLTSSANFNSVGLSGGGGSTGIGSGASGSQIEKKNTQSEPTTNETSEEEVFDFDDPSSFQKKSRQFSTEKQEEKFDWDENISQDKLRTIEETLFPNLFTPSTSSNFFNNNFNNSGSLGDGNNNAPADTWSKLKNLCWSGAPKRYRPLLWRILLSTYPGSNLNLNLQTSQNAFSQQNVASPSADVIQSLNLNDASSYEKIFSTWKQQFTELFRKYSLGFEGNPNNAQMASLFARTMESTNFDCAKTQQYSQFRSAYYDREYKSEYEKQQLKQITIDLPRTFPDLPLFKNMELQNALERSLYIWAIRHPGSGYVQGMNDIFSVFLVVLIQEKFDIFLSFCQSFSSKNTPQTPSSNAPSSPNAHEQPSIQQKNIFFIENFKEFFIQNQRKNFQLFLETKKVSLYSYPKAERDNFLKFVENEVKTKMDTVFEEHLKIMFDCIESDGFWFFNFFVDWIQDYYTPSQPGIKRMMNLLGELTKKIDPVFYKFVTEKHNIDFFQFTFRWMNCLLMRELPLHLIIRLFDAYIAEGGNFPDLHVFVCLAFLLNFKPHIMKCDEYAKIMMFLQNPPTAKWKNSDVEVLLSKSYILKSMYG